MLVCIWIFSRRLCSIVDSHIHTYRAAARQCECIEDALLPDCWLNIIRMRINIRDN